MSLVSSLVRNGLYGEFGAVEYDTKYTYYKNKKFHKSIDKAKRRVYTVKGKS